MGLGKQGKEKIMDQWIKNGNIVNPRLSEKSKIKMSPGYTSLLKIAFRICTAKIFSRLGTDAIFLEINSIKTLRWKGVDI